MKPENLPEHPAFFRLSESEKQILLRASELWEAAAGVRVFHPGDSGEELLLLLHGRLETRISENNTECWLPGDLWGEDRLGDPVPLEFSLTAVEDSRWLSWPREILISLLISSAGLRKSLSPLRDGNGRLLSGFSRRLPVSAGRVKSYRRIRPSLRPAAAGFFPAVLLTALLYMLSLRMEILPPMLYLGIPAVYSGWLLVFLFRRLTREYRVDSDSITSKTFDWGAFTIESRHVPLDKVQGAEIEKNGLFRLILGIGTLIVKTSAMDGELIIKDIHKPEVLRDEIMSFQKKGQMRMKGREREALRKTLGESGLGSAVPVKIQGSEKAEEKGKFSEGVIRFRKSPVVLLGRLLLPVLIALIPVLGGILFSGILPVSRNIVFTLASVPLLWALYRFEDWRNDSFQVSGGYVIDLYRKPLGLKESRRQVELVSVQNIRTEQKGLMPFLFRYGDVILVTAGGAADTVFLSVSRPWKVQETLFHYREKELRNRDLARREQQKDDFIRFTEALDQIR